MVGRGRVQVRASRIGAVDLERSATVRNRKDDTVRLATCPVCASGAELRTEQASSSTIWHYVVCKYNCVRQVGGYGTPEAAAEGWNRKRAMINKVQAVLAGALHEVEQLRDGAMDVKAKQ